MARISKANRLKDIHAEALAEFDDIQGAVGPERLQCLEDRRFYSISGAQWEGALGEQFENKPRFEFNKVHLAVIRIINEYRNNRVTVDFTTRDGSTDDKLADACDGLYRADEKSSVADEAYDNAFEEAAGGGIGAWRLRAAYEDDEDDEDDRQRVRIEPIHDADSCVFFDLGAKRQDKSDAKRCYVLTPYTVDAYREEFDDEPNSWERTIQATKFDWATQDIVWVCEHYRIEEKSELIHFFRGIDESAEDMEVHEDELIADPEKRAELEATGFREVRQKRIKRRAVHKYILSGGGVLEDCGLIPGKHIPIVMTFGKRWVVDGVERCMGHVRLAKDAQRLQNSLMSWLADLAGRFDTEKPILTPEQVLGHAQMWAEDNVRRYPYLLLNPVTGLDGNPMPAGPIGYTKAPNIPPAMAALTQLAEQSLQDLLGNQQAGEQLQPNMSGKAVELVQQRLDMQVFIYMSNFSKAMKRSGEIWLSMMKDIVVEPDRKMKTIGPDGASGSVVVNAPRVDRATGADIIENDLTRASFEVDVDVGPSSTSKRAATVRALTGMMQITADPETLSVLTGLAMLNMEGEGMSDVREYFRAKMIRMGAVKPTEEEAQELEAQRANAKLDPQAQALTAMAEEASANAANARAKTIQTLADADLKRAQTEKTFAEVQGTGHAQQIASVQALRDIWQQPQQGQQPNSQKQ
jgi:hypothetical protein